MRLMDEKKQQFTNDLDALRVSVSEDDEDNNNSSLSASSSHRYFARNSLNVLHHHHNHHHPQYHHQFHQNPHHSSQSQSSAIPISSSDSAKLLQERKSLKQLQHDILGASIVSPNSDSLLSSSPSGENIKIIHELESSTSAAIVHAATRAD